MGGMVGGGGGGGKFAAAPQQYGGSAPGVGYTNPRDSVGAPYVPTYTPQTATPFLQSIMAQQMGSAQSNNLGLPSLQSMFNMPQARSPLQANGIQQLAPMAPYMGSTYRPNMSGVMNRLNNVAPSVELQQRLDAEEAARQAAIDAANAPPPSNDYGGGGA